MIYENGALNVRQRETLKALIIFLKRNLIVKPRKYLDLGCSDGSFTLEVARILGAQEVYGVDIDYESLNKARCKGVKIYTADLNTNKSPFMNSEFDVISAFEVIEHLWNTDNMLKETYRVLKPRGFFILTTPNLASWVNRLLLIFGYLPAHYGCSSKYGLEKRPFERASSPCEHIRLYTFKTLQKHLEAYGFKVVYSTGYSMGTCKLIAKLLNKIFSKKTFRAGMFFVAVKE